MGIPSVDQQYFLLLCPWKSFQHDATFKCEYSSFPSTCLKTLCHLPNANLQFVDWRALQEVGVHSSFRQIVDAGHLLFMDRLDYLGTWVSDSLVSPVYRYRFLEYMALLIRIQEFPVV